MRWTVRTRIAVDLIAAVSLSMIVVGFATLLAARQLLNNNGAEMTEQLASSLAAQISRMRASGRSLAHPDNRLILESFLGDEVFAGRNVELTVRSVSGQVAWQLKNPVGEEPLSAHVAIAGGGTLVLRMANEPGREAVGSLTELLLSLILGSVVLVSLISWWLLSRSVGKPVARLIEAVERVKTDAAELPPLGEAGSELAALHKAIDRMRLRSEQARLELGERHTALQSAHDDLLKAQRVAQRAEHLAGVGRLAAGIAHEVGNPLSALLGFVQLLRSGRIPDDQQTEVLERLESELERIRGIIGGLLTYARPARPTLTAVDVRRVIEPTVALVRADKSFRAVAIEMEVDERLPQVLCDEGGLRQVLVNLCLNAAEACQNQEGSQVIVSASRVDDRVIVAVDDSGPGVSTSVESTLFEPFVTTKDVGKGTGLGLSVCQGIVQSWDASLSVGVSRLGGARFEVSIALVRSEAS